MENNMKYDFAGWATRNDLVCGDGRVICHDAFKDCDGKTVPLVWNHQHNSVDNVLGHALLENREEGVYFYGTFNDTPSGQKAKAIVQHGDVYSVSIFANKLKQMGRNVVHGVIRELSVVLAPANPGATIDLVMAHSEDGLDNCDEVESFVANWDERIVLYHSEYEPKSEKKTEDSAKNEQKDGSTEEPKNDNSKKEDQKDKKTVQDIIDTMNEEQQQLLYGLVGMIKEGNNDDEKDEGGEKEMKHNLFEGREENNSNTLSHADQMEIISLAKMSNVGTLQNAIKLYAEQHSDTLAHGITDIESLFPEYKLTNSGEPEMITRDQTWVDGVINGVRKSPISRIRTRQADVRPETIKAMGYEKKKEKKLIGDITLINRTTDPQTVYVKDKLERDDIIDIVDFDVVNYQKKIMRMALNEKLATAIMIGDGLASGTEGKIQEDKIRPIWTDSDLYTIHADVDIAAAKAELQGTNTSANFGDNYVYAEAIITAALYAREHYKGSGSLEFYCTPHLLNVMLLARDMNGRRLYESVTDLAAALNVTKIQTAEQFEGKTRTENVEGQVKTKKLLGLFVNLNDYQLGATKGGQITNFEDFDIDFNQYKYLMETRVSGALTKVFSAIALEEDVTQAAG